MGAGKQGVNQTTGVVYQVWYIPRKPDQNAYSGNTYRTREGAIGAAVEWKAGSPESDYDVEVRCITTVTHTEVIHVD